MKIVYETFDGTIWDSEEKAREFEELHRSAQRDELLEEIIDWFQESSTFLSRNACTDSWKPDEILGTLTDCLEDFIKKFSG